MSHRLAVMDPAGSPRSGRRSTSTSSRRRRTWPTSSASPTCSTPTGEPAGADGAGCASGSFTLDATGDGRRRRGAARDPPRAGARHGRCRERPELPAGDGRARRLRRLDDAGPRPPARRRGAAVADDQHRRRPRLACWHAGRASSCRPTRCAPSRRDRGAPRVVGGPRPAARRAGRAACGVTSDPDAPLGRTPSRADVAALAAITPDGVGCRRRARPRRRRAAAEQRRPRPPPVPRLHPGRSGDDGGAVRGGRRGVVVLRRELAGGRCRRGRREAALDWLRTLVGLPDGAGGCFVSGGSAGNLSAPRRRPRRRGGAAHPRRRVGWPSPSPRRRTRRCAAPPHLLDLDVVEVAGDAHDRLDRRRRLPRSTDADVCAVVASAGATNTGASTTSPASPTCAPARGWWLHVDAAYGGAALAVPELAGRFAGIERADSVVIDPHKWLFAPLDCAAVLYRDPGAAAATHRQPAAYLDAFGDAHVNPSDLAFHLTRRARGLPFWFALVVHGTDAYGAAVRAGVELARRTADLVRHAGPPVELVMEPELSVVLFERRGWTTPTGTRGRPTRSPTASPSSPRRSGRAGRRPLRVPPPGHRRDGRRGRWWPGCADTLRSPRSGRSSGCPAARAGARGPASSACCSRR